MNLSIYEELEKIGDDLTGFVSKYADSPVFWILLFFGLLFLCMLAFDSLQK